MHLGINIINKFIYLVVSLLVLISCGGGSNSESLNIDNTSEASSSIVGPTTLLTANKTVVVSGDSFILSWSSTNASSCSASGSWSGSKSLSGSQRIASDSYGDHTYYLNCSGAIASIEINVTDEDSEGSCTNPHNAKIKESYLGNFDIPIPQGLFGEDHLKAIGFKDYGVKWIYQNYKGRNAAWISDCTEQEYIKLMYRTALRQLKENGVETAWIYNFGYWEDYQAETWKINHSRKHIEDWTVEFIANTAKEMDMNMHYAWQFLALDDENNMLFPFDGMVYVDMPLLKKILDSHEEHILWEADRLESLGVGSISADWSAMYVCFCGLQNELDQQERDQLKSYYAERMGSIVSHIKSRFSGEIYLGEGIIFNDSRLFNKVDGVIGSFPNMLAMGEEQTATVELIEDRTLKYIAQLFETWTCSDQQPCWEFTSYDLPPIIWNLFAQSHKMFISTGWLEDGFCTPGTYKNVYYDDCMQYEVPTDFSAQAIFVEGLLRAIDKQSLFVTKGTTASTAYWLSDTLIPDENQYGSDCGRAFGSCGVEGFPNISQSVRGKPAENIIQAWYKGEYEQYNPEYD
ncbi:hypothetical protein OAM46_01460 [Gammaproteobacteria bacterium]|nr:hypothetical protein [Gammaproteobacteria bacterium]